MRLIHMMSTSELMWANRMENMLHRRTAMAASRTCIMPSGGNCILKADQRCPNTRQIPISLQHRWKGNTWGNCKPANILLGHMSLTAIINRFCSAAHLDPDDLLERMKMTARPRKVWTHQMRLWYSTFHAFLGSDNITTFSSFNLPYLESSWVIQTIFGWTSCHCTSCTVTI